MEGAKHRQGQVRSEIKVLAEFRDSAAQNSVQLSVTEEQLESQLEGFRHNTELVDAEVEQARDDLTTAELALRDFETKKLVDNIADLNQEREVLDQKLLELHRDLAQLVRSQESAMRSAQETEEDLLKVSSDFTTELEQIHQLVDAHRELRERLQVSLRDLKASLHE